MYIFFLKLINILKDYKNKIPKCTATSLNPKILPCYS